MDRSLLQRIESFLKLSDMPPSVFGRHAAKDPRLVSDMRGGREVGRRLASQIEHFMNIWQEQQKRGQVNCVGDLRTRQARERMATASRHRNPANSVADTQGILR